MQKVIPTSPLQNRFLAELKEEDYARLLPELELVEMPLGHTIHGIGVKVEHVYFPTSCAVSRVSITLDGGMLELGMTGNEGMVGVSIVLGRNISTHMVVVKNAGAAYRLRADVMRWELEQSCSLRRFAQRYALVLMTQLAQTALCNRHHSVEQQLCRWLLLTLDRSPSNQITMTQAQIADMIGVRREAVTEAVGRLQTAGLIGHRRGCLTIKDRSGLEARSCECYAVVKAQYERLFQASPHFLSIHHPPTNPLTLRRRSTDCPPVPADQPASCCRPPTAGEH